MTSLQDKIRSMQCGWEELDIDDVPANQTFYQGMMFFVSSDSKTKFSHNAYPDTAKRMQEALLVLVEAVEIMRDPKTMWIESKSVDRHMDEALAEAEKILEGKQKDNHRENN